MFLRSALACASIALQMFPLLTITHVHVHAHTPANAGTWFGLHSSGEASFDPVFLTAPGSQKPCPHLPGFCPRTHHSTMIPGCLEEEQEQAHFLPVSHKIVQSLPRCSTVRAQGHPALGGRAVWTAAKGRAFQVRQSPAVWGGPPVLSGDRPCLQDDRQL